MYKYKYSPKIQRGSSVPMIGDAIARRAAYGGGGRGAAEMGHGLGALGAGIGSYLASIGQNRAANAEMQQYNTINPPRGSLVGVPGESVDQWAAQNPNVPTEQSTVPAPYGQGTVGMQNWMEMQREMQAEDAAKQESIMRGLKAADIQQTMQGRALGMPGGPLYRGPGGPMYRPLPGQQGAPMNHADRKVVAGIADAHALIQQKFGQDVDAQTLGQFAGQWMQDPNSPGAMINPALAKHLNVDPAKTAVDSATLQKVSPIIQQEILLRQQHPDFFQQQQAAQGSGEEASGPSGNTGGSFVQSVIGGQQGQAQQGDTNTSQAQPSPVQQQMQSAGTSGPAAPPVNPAVYSGGPNSASVQNAQVAKPPPDWWRFLGITPGT